MRTHLLAITLKELGAWLAVLKLPSNLESSHFHRLNSKRPDGQALCCKK